MAATDSGLQPALLVTFERLVAEAAHLTRTQTTVRVIARLAQFCPDVAFLVLEYRTWRLGVHMGGRLPEGIRIGALVEVTGRLYSVPDSTPTATWSSLATHPRLRLPRWFFTESFVGFRYSPERDRDAFGERPSEHQPHVTAKVLLDAVALRCVDGLDMVLYEQALREREAYLREYFACVEAAAAFVDQAAEASSRQGLVETAEPIDTNMATR